MRTGWYISAAGHGALIVFILFGGLFVSDRFEEVTVSEVTVLSEAEYAALLPPATAPDVATDAPEVALPEEDQAPETPVEDTAPEVSEPEPVEEPETPENPELTIPQPIPDAVVEDDAPIINTPDTDIDGSSPVADGTPQPAPRVAPTPSIAPPPLAEAAPERVEETAPDPEALPEEVVEEETPAAPEEASDRIVTEAEETPELAPASSMRPRSRPARPVRQAETQPETTTEDAVAAAVAEANETPAPSAPTGPPLTGGERDALRVAVSSCWNVGSLSTDALGTTVIVAVSMNQDGTPMNDSIRMVTSSGGSDGAARQAFEAARRAIIRCGARGFPLPVEKYSQWRDIEMTFNPEGMQFR
ncbi:MAG: energy transducer TonB [Boseongicola sp.]|nr:energy transducer TonB [Boseongicola sp.]